MTLLVATVLHASTGCTLIGMGIGSAFPRYEDVASPPHLDEAPPTAPPSYGAQAPPIAPPSYEIAVEPGEEIKVVRASDHREFQGIFTGIVGDELVLATDDGPATIKVTDIGRPFWVRGVPVRGRFRLRRGSYSGTGGLIGLSLDTIAIVVFAVAFQRWEDAGNRR